MLLRGPGFYERYEFNDAPGEVRLRRRSRPPAPFHTLWCVPPGYQLIEATESGPLELTPDTGPVRRFDPPEIPLGLRADATGQRLRPQLAELGLEWPGPPIPAGAPPPVRPVRIRPER